MKRHRFDLPKNFLISSAILLLSLLLYTVFPSKHRMYTLFAMMFSTLGDMALMDFKGFFSRHFRNPFIVGGCFFVVSHILYVLAYIYLLRTYTVQPSSIGIIIACGIGTVEILLLILKSQKSGCFSVQKTILFLLYSAVEILDCVFVFAAVFAIGFQEIAYLWRIIGAIGACSFLVSDYFIGMEYVAGDASMQRYIWTFYTIGQILMQLAA